LFDEFVRLTLTVSVCGQINANDSTTSTTTHATLSTVSNIQKQLIQTICLLIARTFYHVLFCSFFLLPYRVAQKSNPL